MSRARRRSGAPRCRSCNAPVLFLLRGTTGRWRAFHPKPVHPAGPLSAAGYPVESNRAWTDRELVEELLLRHQYLRSEAEAEVRDLPRYLPHQCDTTPTPEGGTDQ